ncbi:hypothetical protein F8568_044430 [Actinomadura sp. LD22]|uniref:Uncharacterized protein n=1 Tax=Actinomadura physcomitrii TaxID=2650748 RepID=A0A6I4MNH0_9ACTN|nr:hypothetical protein [Actinomadura physcomitrii]MWA07263.1 hypothetical protein [Actinomadura physcomitrii]
MGVQQDRPGDTFTRLPLKRALDQGPEEPAAAIGQSGIGVNPPRGFMPRGATRQPGIDRIERVLTTGS